MFKQMRQALNMIHFIVTEGGSSQMNGHTSPITSGDSGIGLDNAHPLASKALKDLEVCSVYMYIFQRFLWYIVN